MLGIAQEGVFNLSHYRKYYVTVWKNIVKLPSLSLSLSPYICLMVLAKVHCCVRLHSKILLIRILFKEKETSLQLCNSASSKTSLAFLPMVFF